MADTVFAISTFISGLALMAVGFVHFFKYVLGHNWCEDSCFGPYLFWNEDDFLDDTNPRFRQTFSLMPKPFGENFGVFFLAYLTLRAHFRMKYEFLNTFTRSAFWMLFVSFFGAFPFAGGLGIVVGFFCCATAAFGFACRLFGNSGSPNLDIALENRDGGTLRGCGNMRFPGWFFKIWNAFFIFLLGMTMLNNLVHVLKNEVHTWCKNPAHNDSCIGPYLIWPNDFVKSVNADKWGAVFSLDLNRGLELWTPTLLVIWFMSTGNESWLSTFCFLAILALFGAFGFAGNLGIVVGVMLLVGCGVSLLVAVCGGNDNQPQIHGYTLFTGV